MSEFLQLVQNSSISDLVGPSIIILDMVFFPPSLSFLAYLLNPISEHRSTLSMVKGFSLVTMLQLCTSHRQSMRWFYESSLQRRPTRPFEQVEKATCGTTPCARTTLQQSFSKPNLSMESVTSLCPVVPAP